MWQVVLATYLYLVPAALLYDLKTLLSRCNYLLAIKILVSKEEDCESTRFRKREEGSVSVDGYGNSGFCNGRIVFAGTRFGLDRRCQNAAFHAR
jgi:hypothetical protein